MILDVDYQGRLGFNPSQVTRGVLLFSKSGVRVEGVTFRCFENVYQLLATGPEPWRWDLYLGDTLLQAVQISRESKRWILEFGLLEDWGHTILLSDFDPDWSMRESGRGPSVWDRISECCSTPSYEAESEVV